MSDDDSFGSDLEPSSEEFDDDDDIESDFDDDAPKKKPAKTAKAPTKTAKTTKGKTVAKETPAATKKTPAKSSGGARIVTTPVTQSSLLQHARMCGQSRSSHLPPLHHIKA